MRRKGQLPNGKWDPLYQAWRSAKGRCRNRNKPDYPYYGGRGVTFSKKWDTYEAFEADMGPHPGKGWTLERKDNDKGYEPGNCEWATRLTQSRNRPGYVLPQADVDKIRKLYVRGKVRQVDLAARFGVCQHTISSIVRRLTWL